MSVADFRKKYHEYNVQIENLKKERDRFCRENQEKFKAETEQKKILDRKWFVENIDYIGRYKNKIQNSSLFGSIIIDFLPVYKIGGLVGGAAFGGEQSAICLKDLLTAWDQGFLYRNNPIISFEHYIHHGHKYKITYIKDKQEFVAELFDKEYKSQLHEQMDCLEKMIKNYALRQSDFSLWDSYNTIDILKKNSNYPAVFCKQKQGVGDKIPS